MTWASCLPLHLQKVKKKVQPPTTRTCHYSWMKPGCNRKKTEGRNHIFSKGQIRVGHCEAHSTEIAPWSMDKSHSEHAPSLPSSSSGHVPLSVFYGDFYLTVPIRSYNKFCILPNLLYMFQLKINSTTFWDVNASRS